MSWTVVERIDSLLMQVERFLLVLQVDIVDVNETIERRTDDVLQVRVVLNFSDPRVVHQNVSLSIASLEDVVLLWIGFDDLNGLLLALIFKHTSVGLLCTSSLFFDGILTIIPLLFDVVVESLDDLVAVASEDVGV